MALQKLPTIIKVANTYSNGGKQERTQYYKSFEKSLAVLHGVFQSNPLEQLPTKVK